MRISIITTMGNERFGPDERGDAFVEALASYTELADEVVVVRGDDKTPNIVHTDAEEYINFGKIKTVRMKWPYEWSWEELPKHLNAGLEMATGDWIIKCDIDYIFHEKHIDEIRRRLSKINSHIATFQKYSFVLTDRYYQKGSIPIAINKGMFGDKIRFGLATNKETDLCYPISVKGISEDNVPFGTYNPESHIKTGLPFYNYDYTFKTKEQALEEFWRFSRAYQRYFGAYKWGSTKEESTKIFLKMMQGNYDKCVYRAKPEDHPKYIRKRIEQIIPTEFGYNGYGLIKTKKL